MGAWVQNIGFGSDWVTTKATIVKDPTDITDQGKVVCIPVVSNGENRADARNKMGVVAVKTYAAGGAQKVVADAKEAAGYKLVDVVDGEYVFDNLPTAVVVLDTISASTEYLPSPTAWSGGPKTTEERLREGRAGPLAHHHAASTRKLRRR